MCAQGYRSDFGDRQVGVIRIVMLPESEMTEGGGRKLFPIKLDRKLHLDLNIGHSLRNGCCTFSANRSFSRNWEI